MEQVALNIRARLPYSAEGFIIHAGIRQDLQNCLALLGQPGFRLCFFTGAAGEGKTHFAVRLMHELGIRDFQPQIVEAGQFCELSCSLPAVDRPTVLILDNAQRYFEGLSGADSGRFVALIEHLRRAQSAVIFLSSSELLSLGCDEHILSRLRPGQGFRIGPPAEEDMPQILQSMLAQRGLSIPERKIEFMLRRLPKNVAGVSQVLDRIQHLALGCGGALDYSVIDSCL